MNVPLTKSLESATKQGRGSRGGRRRALKCKADTQVDKNVIRHLSPHLHARATSRFLQQVNQKFTLRACRRTATIRLSRWPLGNAPNVNGEDVQRAGV